jgi:hypothetical protein
MARELSTYHNLPHSTHAKQGLASGAQLFRDLVQPMELPYEAINYQIQYHRATGAFDTAKLQEESIDYYFSFAIVFGVA